MCILNSSSEVGAFCVYIVLYTQVPCQKLLSSYVCTTGYADFSYTVAHKNLKILI